MPAHPWVMRQTWHDLLFAHWPVPSPLLASKIPPGLELDLFDGQAWLGIVPFRMSGVAPRWTPPLPGLSAFPELNVRTYVRVADKPGVYFFSLDAANALAVAAARTLFHLPYYQASMSVDLLEGTVRYNSRRTKAANGSVSLVASYRAIGEVFNARPGTLEHFLTERYCLYTTRRRSVLIVDIHHAAWPLQAADAAFEANTMADAAGITLPASPPLLHFANRQDVVAWWPRTVPGAVSDGAIR